jgi:hypothetical protein
MKMAVCWVVSRAVRWKFTDVSEELTVSIIREMIRAISTLKRG